MTNQYNAERMLTFFKTTRVLFIVLISSVFIFTLLAISFNNPSFEVFDNDLSSFIQLLRAPFLTHFLKLITESGDTFGYVIIISIFAIVLFTKKQWKPVFQVIILLLASSLLNIILKEIINRPRPFGSALIEVTFHSFPSGHAMSAMVFYGFMIFLIVKFIKIPILKICLICISVIMIFLIGISRVYLGVHHPTDVLAGYAAGLACVSLYIIILKFKAFN